MWLAAILHFVLNVLDRGSRACQQPISHLLITVLRRREIVREAFFFVLFSLSNTMLSQPNFACMGLYFIGRREVLLVFTPVSFCLLA